MVPPLVVRLRHPCHQVSERHERETVETGQILVRNSVRRVEVVHVAEQEPERVADAPVRLARAFENLIGDAHVLGVVGCRHPQTDDVRAVLGDDIERRDHVAERLRHLTTLAVHDEAVGEHAAERSLTVHAHAREKRGLEPATMLVRTLKVKFSWTPQLRAGFQNARVRDARLEPHVDDVALRKQLTGAASRAHCPCREVLGRRLREPGVRALPGEELLYGSERGIVGDRLPAGRALEDRDRHAPRPLPADAPVGPVGHHRGDAVHRPSRDPLDLTDSRKSGIAQTRAVHGDEPLLGGAEDDGALAAPAVRIAVRHLRCVNEHATFFEPGDDRGVRLIDMQASEGAAAHVEPAVVVHGHRRGQAESLPHQIVVLAMPRRCVYGTRAGGELHVVARDDDSRATRVDRQLV